MAVPREPFDLCALARSGPACGGRGLPKTGGRPGRRARGAAGAALTVEDAKRLLSTIQGARLEAFFVLALTTGLHRGELLAWR